MKSRRKVILGCFFIIQITMSQPVFSLTLSQAVQQAITTYPGVHAALEQVSAAASGISLARTKYLPRVDLLGQVNRATHNNVFGLLLPQSVIPSISGPVLGTNSLSSVWGSAVGGLVSWEPFDFGLRRANLEAARAIRDQADAEANVTKLQTGTAAADAFLTILAAQETAAAAQAGAERARIVNQIVETLVKNELRPGADASRTRAELALAEIQVIQAQEAVAVGRAALAQLLGIPATAVELQPESLLKMPPEQDPAAMALLKHPLAMAQQESVLAVQMREKTISRSAYPKISLQSALFARGTGAQPNGVAGGGASGLGPNIQNWGAGISVTFPAFDIFSLRAQREAEQHRERAAADRYRQVLQDLNGGLEKAKAVLAAARQIAQKIPIQLEAGRTGEQQAVARYKSGLANVVEVAEAERILTQAEIDDRLARLGVWRALLGMAAAVGDLEPFLELSRN